MQELCGCLLNLENMLKLYNKLLQLHNTGSSSKAYPRNVQFKVNFWQSSKFIPSKINHPMICILKQ